jgi:hypothetical protein
LFEREVLKNFFASRPFFIPPSSGQPKKFRGGADGGFRKQNLQFIHFFITLFYLVDNPKNIEGGDDGGFSRYFFASRPFFTPPPPPPSLEQPKKNLMGFFMNLSRQNFRSGGGDGGFFQEFFAQVIHFLPRFTRVAKKFLPYARFDAPSTRRPGAAALSPRYAAGSILEMKDEWNGCRSARERCKALLEGRDFQTLERCINFSTLLFFSATITNNLSTAHCVICSA